MKQLNLLKTLFLLCALVVGSSSAWADDSWSRVTDKKTLLDGGTFIIGYEATAKSGIIVPMANIGSATTSTAGFMYSGSTAASGGSGTIDMSSVTTTSKYEVEIGESSEVPGAIYIKIGDNYLGNENTKNNCKLFASQAATTSFTPTFGSNDNVTLDIEANTSDNKYRYLKYNTGAPRFAVYSTTPENIVIYKKIEDARTPIATIGDLTPVKIAKDASGSFSVGITAADTYTVSYESSDNDVLLIVADEYLAGSSKGNVTVTVTVTPDDAVTYKPVSKEFAVSVYDPNEGDGSLERPYSVAEARAAIDAGTGITGVYATGIVSQIVTAYNPSYGNISYNISTDGLTTSDQLQAYRGKNNNGEDFTSADDVKVGDIVVVKGNLKKYSSTYEFDEGNWLVSRVRKADPELAAVSATIDNMDATTSVAANTLYTVTSDGEISFSSDKEDVANVVAGTLYAYKPGTAKITVSVAETAAYAAGNVDITVTVTSKAAKDPEGPAAGSTYSLVTDAATLKAGDNLLITSTGSYTYSKVTYNFSWVMAGQNGSIRSVEDVTISENTITTVPANAQVVTLEEAPESKWYLSVGSGNYLNSDDKAVTTSTAKTAFEITISGNDATITNGTYSLQCNPNSGNGRFACYSSTQKPVQIYRQNVASTFDITIDSKGDGWRTIVTAVNATLPSGLKAYIAKADESDKVTLTEVASLKANNAYILYGAAGVYTLTVTDSPAEPTGNELRVSTDADGNGAFVLAKKSGVVGFYKWTGGSLGAGRVILPASAIPDASARDFIGLGDATAISNVTVKTKSDNSYYNLAGQRVAQPQKGLYIVNGKKVIIK